jgi:hypothetical protein
MEIPNNLENTEKIFFSILCHLLEDVNIHELGTSKIYEYMIQILDMLHPHMLPAHFGKSLGRKTLGRTRNIWKNLN